MPKAKLAKKEKDRGHMEQEEVGSQQNQTATAVGFIPHRVCGFIVHASFLPFLPPPFFLPHQYNEKLEIISLNLNTLKVEEDAIQAQKMALIRERNLHVSLLECQGRGKKDKEHCGRAKLGVLFVPCALGLHYRCGK